MAETQDHIGIPEQLAWKGITAAQLVEKAWANWPNDEEAALLPGWVVDVLRNPTDKLPKRINDALVYMEYYRMEQRRQQLAAWIHENYGYRLVQEQIDTLWTPLTFVDGKLDYEAKNRLLRLLWHVNWAIDMDAGWNASETSEADA